MRLGFGLVLPPFPAPRRNERLAALIFNVICSFAVLALLFVSAVSYAQVAASPGAPAGTQSVLVTLLLQLGPFLIVALVALHPALKLGAFLHALAKKHAGFAAQLIEDAAVGADDVDALMVRNQQQLKDLADPAKRAAAEATLAADAIATAKADAKAAVDAALARALPRG